MKGINTWSYHPYCPLLTEVGDPTRKDRLPVTLEIFHKK